MNKRSVNNRRVKRQRRGAMIVVMLLMLVVLLGMAALSVDTAYMMLARTELQAATDAAAKAAARKLSLTDGDQVQALAEGKRFASLNRVGGHSLKLASEDFQFGRASKTKGKWAFAETSPPYSAVRVVSDTKLSGDVGLFFGPIFGLDSFTPHTVATAYFPKSEIVLAIDRSHSMAFDDSGRNWKYPPGIPASDTDGDGSIDFRDDALLSPPHPTSSRWAAMESAVKLFVDTLNSASNPPDVGLLTWASYLGPETREVQLTGLSMEPTSVEVPIGDKYQAITAALKARGSVMMLGGTNAAAGIDDSVAMFSASNLSTKRYIILMTDGQENRGRGAIKAAQDARRAGVVIHTVTFLKGDQKAMKQVAIVTGGQHIHASTPEELEKAFVHLARLVPVSLVE